MIPVDKKILSPNFTRGRKTFKPEAIVIHIMEGTLLGTDSWFANKDSKVSAHFGIGQNGDLHQYVELSDTAWHTGRVSNPSWIGIKSNSNGAFFNPNYYTFGIEHEGLGTTVWTNEIYHKSAELIANLCVDFHIPLDRSHIIGHHEIYSIKSCPGQKVNFNILLALADQYRMLLTEPGSPAPTAVATTLQALDFIASPGTVSVIKNLNIRSKSPSITAKIEFVAPIGSALGYVGWVTNGQPINGNRKWFRDVNGDYFWSGATL
jgi:N-acetylmuramoyl-L-alanine amidase